MTLPNKGEMGKTCGRNLREGMYRRSNPKLLNVLWLTAKRGKWRGWGEVIWQGGVNNKVACIWAKYTGTRSHRNKRPMKK